MMRKRLRSNFSRLLFSCVWRGKDAIIALEILIKGEVAYAQTL